MEDRLRLCVWRICASASATRVWRLFIVISGHAHALSHFPLAIFLNANAAMRANADNATMRPSMRPCGMPLPFCALLVLAQGFSCCRFCGSKHCIVMVRNKWKKMGNLV
jgi:hypothetical protein